MNAPRSPTRPALALRIGITGARSLDAAQLPHLSDQLQDTFDQRIYQRGNLLT
jgi:hypothetical protein